MYQCLAPYRSGAQQERQLTADQHPTDVDKCSDCEEEEKEDDDEEELEEKVEEAQEGNKTTPGATASATRANPPRAARPGAGAFLPEVGAHKRKAADGEDEDDEDDEDGGYRLPMHPRPDPPIFSALRPPPGPGILTSGRSTASSSGSPGGPRRRVRFEFSGSPWEQRSPGADEVALWHAPDEEAAPGAAPEEEAGAEGDAAALNAPAAAGSVSHEAAVRIVEETSDYDDYSGEEEE